MISVAGQSACQSDSTQSTSLLPSHGLSGPSPVPPALLQASSARPGSANLPRQCLTAHAPEPAWPSAARFPCTGPLPSLPRPKQYRCAGRSFAAYPAPSLPARPTSRLKRPDPHQSKQGLLACPILSLPARACACTLLMITAQHYPGPLSSSARSSLSSTVRSSSRARAPAQRRPHRRFVMPTMSTLVTGLCLPLRGALALPIAWTRCAQLTPPRARCRFSSAPATASTPTPNLNVSLPKTPSQNLNLSLPRLRPKSPST